MMNLLPQENQKKVKKEYLLRLYSVILLLLIFTLVIAFTLFLPYYISIKKELSDKKDYLSVLVDNNINATSGMLEIVEDTKRKIDILVGKKDERLGVYSDIIAPIVDKRGAVLITGITYEESTEERFYVRLSGISLSREDLRTFIKALEKEDLFIEVNAPISNFVKDKDIRFSLDVKIGGVI